MLCPVCNIELLLSEKQGIEIDYCPKCRGIWLDRGELDKIIEKNNGTREMEGRRERVMGEMQHGDDHYREKNYHHDDYKHNKYRKKSLLSDLFDF